MLFGRVRSFSVGKLHAVHDLYWKVILHRRNMLTMTMLTYCLWVHFHLGVVHEVLGSDYQCTASED